MSSVRRTLWVESIDLVQFDGESVIPTALCYEKDKLSVGYSAIRKLRENKIVNVNFKLNLGDHSPKAKRWKLFESEDQDERNALQLTGDFFKTILDNVKKQKFYSPEAQKKLKIMVAEPLAFQIRDRSESWLKNYRACIREILCDYATVEFLPEAFAVYQYYRYGSRIPELSSRSKHVALIIDLGAALLGRPPNN
jgi:hypothetical protein